jgi:hypothetical protein
LWQTSGYKPEQWVRALKAVYLQSVTIFFCNQLFRREFCFPIERSSSRALDRRRHP